MSEAYRIRKMREAIKLALPLLREDRDSLADCNSVIDRKTGQRVLDAAEDVRFDLLRYDTAIEQCQRVLQGKKAAKG